jgi:hypothetical protein
MLREAAAIWRPAGVAIVAAPPLGGTAVAVRVQLAAGPTSGRLGSIVFGPDHRPEPAVSVHVDAIARMIDSASVAGRPLARWPAAAVDAVAGRALGRVLAHEIGHFLLALRTHRPTGLMRPGFDAVLLTHPDRAPFALTGDELAQLRARLAELAATETIAANAP